MRSHTLKSMLRIVRNCATLNQPPRHRLEFIKRHRADVALSSFAHRNFAFLQLAVTKHEHERNFLHLRVPNLRANLVAAHVDLDPQARRAQFLRNLLGIFINAVRDWQHCDLYWRQPHRKRAGVMLDQHAEESFDRSEQRPMHHHGPMGLVVFADVLQFESFRQIEIPLHCAELPQAPNRIFDLEIDFRAIERRFAFHALVINAASIQCRSQRTFSLRPIFFFAQIDLAGVVPFYRQLELDLVKAERLQNLVSEVNAVINLSANLPRRAEQMRIVNREPAHAHQAVQSARQFRAIDGAHFRVALRQVAIRSLLRFVYADVHRAIHRLKTELGFFELGRREHRVAVVLLMTTQLPKLALRDVRSVNKTVVALDQFFAQVIVHLLADDAALRMPEDQALPVLLLNRKQIEFATQPAMIALLSFFALFQPRLEFLRREERRAVDALHLRSLSVAFPVRTGQRQKLERAQTVRVRHMRPETKINERRTVDVIHADDLPGLFVNQFALQRLFTFGEDAQRLGLRNLVASIRHVALGNVAHLLLDYGKVSFSQRSRRNHVIEKAITWIFQ